VRGSRRRSTDTAAWINNHRTRPDPASAGSSALHRNGIGGDTFTMPTVPTMEELAEKDPVSHQTIRLRHVVVGLSQLLTDWKSA
jgi:hypothetical protein